MGVDEARAKSVFSSLDTYGVGSLSMEDMKCVLIDLGYSANLSNMLRSFDTNEEGLITFTEFLQGYEKFEEVRNKFLVPSSKPLLADIDVPLGELPVPWSVNDQEKPACRSDDTIIEVINVMVNADVPAVVVLPPKAHSSNSFRGMLDCVDIIAFIASTVPEPVEGNVSADMTTIFDSEFSTKTAQDLLGYATWDKPASIESRKYLRDAVELMVDKQSRRLPVLNEDHEVVNIVSQTTVISLLQHNIALLAKGDEGYGIAQQSIEELKIPRRPIETTNIKGTLLNAVHKLAQSRSTAIAVVDDDNIIQGHLTTKDVCVMIIETGGMDCLLKPLSSFDHFHGSSKSSRVKYMNAMPSETLQDIAQRFVDSKFEVTRIFLVDNWHCPVEQVSLLDILPFALTLERWHGR